MLIDWFTIVAQIINFLILVWLLKKFLYKPILEAIEAREVLIEGKLTSAEKIQSEAKAQRVDLDSKIKDMEDQKQKKMTEINQAAEKEGDRLLEEAKKTVEEFKEKKLKDFQREEEEAHRAIVQKTNAEVFALARKIITDLSGLSLETQIFHTFIQNLKSMSEEEKVKISSISTDDLDQGVIRSSMNLSEDQHHQLDSAISECLKTKISLSYEVVPDLISGIEFVRNGGRLAWSISNYLTSLEQEVEQTLSFKKSVP